MIGKSPPFRLYLIAAFIIGILTVWLPFRLGGIHGYQGPAFLPTIAWLGLFVLGLVLYGRRGLWLLLAAPPALLWLALLGTQLVCARGCG